MPISLPKFLLKPFAATGAKADIPVAADQPAGRAGYDVGFPPINMTPVAAGGIPPFGQDMNGILFDLSKAIQYTQSGVHFPFDSAFATSIGGYPIGAIVSDASDNSILWINGTLNNTAYPAGWTRTGIKQATETVLGTAKIATQTQVNSGSDDSSIVTPKKIRNGFAANITQNGYISLPSWMGGVIFQWGVALSVPGGGGSVVVTLPLTFPYNIFSVTSSRVAAGVSTQAESAITNITTSQITFVNASSNPSSFRYIAIGN